MTFPKTAEVAERERGEEIIRLLKARHPGLKCQVCGKSDWRVGALALLPKALDGQPAGGQKIQPLACGCGHVLLFDAAVFNTQGG